MAVLSPLASPATLGRPAWRDLDFSLFGLVLLLSLWGLLTVASATRPRGDAAFLGAGPPTSISRASSSRTSDAVKQAVWIGIGVTLLIIIASGDYAILMGLQGLIYVTNLAALMGVLFVGRTVNGAKSWIVLGPVSLQVAEFSKIALLLTLGAFLAKRQDRIREPGVVLSSLLYVVPPLLLVLRQPDFGTALALATIWLGMMFFGGARLWHLGAVVGVAVLVFGVAWQKNVLKPYQKDRLAVVFNDSKPGRNAKADPGYQVRQSQIAIGGGGLTGQGYKQGMMTGGNFIPEKQTDFIFAVVGEEFGFVGAAALVGCFCLLLLRCASIAANSNTFYGVLLAGGFTFLLAYHAIINIGMTLRVMPITGVPLPFFSYGGSSFVAFALGIGLLQSVAIRAKRAIVT